MTVRTVSNPAPAKQLAIVLGVILALLILGAIVTPLVLLAA